MKIRDAMDTNCVCVGLTDTLATAIMVLGDSEAIPVCSHGRPVGLLTKASLSEWMERQGPEHTVRKVREAMTVPALVVDSEAEAEMEASRVKEHGANHAVVMDGEKIVGMFSPDRLARRY